MNSIWLSVIVCSGGRTSLFSALISKAYQIPSIHIGKPSIPCKYFTRVLGIEYVKSPVYRRIDYIPTPITPEQAERDGVAFAKKHGLIGRRTWAMLIGGSSRSHRYNHKDWEELALSMNLLAEKYGLQWLITTSRRTGRDVEEIFRRVLRDEYIAHSVWWGEKKEKIVSHYLGASNVAFCTQDSISMITDCVGAGCKTVVVYPENVVFRAGKDDFFIEYLERLRKNKRITRVGIGEVSNISEEHLHAIKVLSISIGHTIYSDFVKDVIPK